MIGVLDFRYGKSVKLEFAPCLVSWVGGAVTPDGFRELVQVTEQSGAPTVTHGEVLIGGVLPV